MEGGVGIGLAELICSLIERPNLLFFDGAAIALVWIRLVASNAFERVEDQLQAVLLSKLEAVCRKSSRNLDLKSAQAFGPIPLFGSGSDAC